MTYDTKIFTKFTNQATFVRGPRYEETMEVVNSDNEDLLDQTELYRSARYGLVRVSAMPTSHARRALDRLSREHGEVARGSELGLALAARAALDGDRATDVPAFGGGRMLRGRDGRFTGAWHERHGRDEAIKLGPNEAALLMFPDEDGLDIARTPGIEEIG